MWNRASRANLVVSLLAFTAFLAILPAALGFGMGVPEVTIWLAVAVAGSLAIVRRHRTAKVQSWEAATARQ